ncbi:MAG: hypothetical protein LBR98_07190 [Syntrophomonadaceae bacterium]|jgi:methionyl-tRNA formyltransferase|nr:hypothetical protein [Syntrophomonadaceae bacterium]
MRILFLYGNDTALGLADWIQQQGNDVFRVNGRLSEKVIDGLGSFELTVSYTYRHIISEKVIARLNGNVVNLHISYLPWNRGASPNQWSWINDTPKGVSIHYVVKKIDAGDIITQKMVHLSPDDTFAGTYKKLNDEIMDLFKEVFRYYSFWEEMRKNPLGKGSFHKVADFAPYERFLSGYDMTIKDFLDGCRLVCQADEEIGGGLEAIKRFPDNYNGGG